MSESTSKTEYIVTYHCKCGSTIVEAYDDYGIALFAADSEFQVHRDTRDWYEVKEVLTITRTIKSTK